MMTGFLQSRVQANIDHWSSCLPTSRLDNGLELRPIRNWAELEQIYKLRYDAFYLRNGDDRHAKHDQGYFCDSVDEVAIHLIAVGVEGAIHASTRLALRSVTPFIADDIYSWESLARKYLLSADDVKQVACISERTASSGKCETATPTQLFSYSVECASIIGCKIMIVASKSSKKARSRYFSRLGFEEYGADAKKQGYDSVILCKSLEQNVKW